jgi:hypothetical protein
MAVRKKCIKAINIKLKVSVEPKTSIILGCDVVSLGKEIPTFPDSILLSFKVGKSCVGDPITHSHHVIS